MLQALQAIRALRPDPEPMYVILNNLNHRGPDLRRWCADNAVELCFTPTTRPGRTRSRRTSVPFGSSLAPTATTRITRPLSKAIRAYLRWHNSHTKDPGTAALERKRRAEMRDEAQRRSGQPRHRAA